MKFIATIAAAPFAIGAVVATADAEHVPRQLILGGTEVPIGTKLYTAGVRATNGGRTYCGGVLITQIHVLTVAICTVLDPPNFVAVGTHFNSGKEDGEHFKVVSVKRHPLYKKLQAYNFALLTLDRASTYMPMQLSNTTTETGSTLTALGWGLTMYVENAYSRVLRRLDMKVWDQERCKKLYDLGADNTSFCAGCEYNKVTCNGDMGGPVITETGSGKDLDDVLVGLTAYGYECGTPSIASLYSRVSAVLEWIKSNIKTK